MKYIRSFRYKGITIYEGKPTKDGRKYFFKKYKNGKHYSSPMYKTPDEVVIAHSKYVLKNDTPINKRFDLIADEYFEYLNTIRKPGTVNSYLKAYRTHIKDFFGKSYINALSVKDIREWEEKMLKKEQLSSNGIDFKKGTSLSVDYLNKCYLILKAIFDYAIKNYGLETNPAFIYGGFQQTTNPIIKEKERNYITFKEFEELIAVIDHPLWYAYFNFLWYADTRKGEAMALHWNRINFETNRIIIKTTLQVDIKGKIFENTTKTNDERIVMMNKELHRVLYNYKLEQQKYKDFNENWYVFGGPTPISKTTADRKKHEYFTKAGVYEITNHQFRHSLTTELIKRYVEQQQKRNMKIDKYAFLSALANRNGHTVETMMKYYANLFPDTEQEQVIDLLDSLKETA